ncbi:Uncharacterised protein [Starkeya nomas]|uniref:Uncharacterized protein n=1 Tax=Starkeya nomas TaxID=2666134 RepID=A0A5S9NHV2_9HYPH|nr:Uncharacterised protein [Starkeya nomas]
MPLREDDRGEAGLRSDVPHRARRRVSRDKRERTRRGSTSTPALSSSPPRGRSIRSRHPTEFEGRQVLTNIPPGRRTTNHRHGHMRMDACAGQHANRGGAFSHDARADGARQPTSEPTPPRRGPWREPTRTWRRRREAGSRPTGPDPDPRGALSKRANVNPRARSPAIAAHRAGREGCEPSCPLRHRPRHRSCRRSPVRASRRSFRDGRFRESPTGGAPHSRSARR